MKRVAHGIFAANFGIWLGIGLAAAMLTLGISGCTVRAHLSSLDVCFEEGCLVDTTSGESSTKSRNKNPQGFWAGLAGAQVVHDALEPAPVTVTTTETKTTTAPEAALLPEAAK